MARPSKKDLDKKFPGFIEKGERLYENRSKLKRAVDRLRERETKRGNTNYVPTDEEIFAEYVLLKGTWMDSEGVRHNVDA